MKKEKLILIIKKYFHILSMFLYSMSLLNLYILPEYKRISLLLVIMASIVLLVYLNFEKNKVCSFFKAKKSQKGINSVFSFIMFFLIIVALNFIFSKNDLKHDFTKNKIHTLSEQTINVLKNLKSELKIIAFIPSIQTDFFKNSINKYQHYTSKLSYEIIDPSKEPIKAKSFDVNSNNTFVVVSGENIAKFYDELSEENITNSIIKVLRERLKKIYFLTNHGEKSIFDENKDGYSQITKKLQGQNYLVEELNLLDTALIPEDAELIIVAGPNKEFFEQEKTLLVDYISSGKSILLMLDPVVENSKIIKNSLLDFITKDIKADFAGDLIVDPSPALFGATATMPVVKEYNSTHRITKDFNLPSFFPNAQSIIINEENTSLNATELCKTSSKSWGEYNIRSGSVSFEAGEDRVGPLNVCLIIEKEEELNMVLIGDSDFASNQYLNFVGNADLFLNIVSYLLKDEDLLSIRPKTQDQAFFSIKPVYMRLLAIATMYLIPFVVLVFGIVFWIKRRKQ